MGQRAPLSACTAAGPDPEMTMATSTLTVKLTVAWWLPVYLHTLALFCVTLGTQPDMDKVSRVVLKAIRIRIE